MKRNAIIVFLLSFAITAACARPVDNWSYERLFKESDLVVIAQPVQSEDSPDRTKDDLWKIEFIGINTKFDALHVLKGKCKSAKLTVLHFRANVLIENGPGFVTFRTKDLRYTLQDRTIVEAAGPSRYLLFLKKRDDGRYEPVSGRTDPILSVEELRMPIRTEADK
jgi:hypothetical protein